MMRGKLMSLHVLLELPVSDLVQQRKKLSSIHSINRVLRGKQGMLEGKLELPGEEEAERSL